jgi:alcohol dehydrogenase YqhD (iron-dependent ADH family)
MESFVFHNRTKIFFGRGTIPIIGREAAICGKRVLLVYGGGSIKANTLYQQVVTSLQDAGLTITEFGNIRPNPILSKVRQGIAITKRQGIELIVAVGGGSVLDSGKAIGAGALVDHDVWKFFAGKKSVVGSLPVFCLPTLAASGSEMNGAMVITNEERQLKFGFANRHLFPRVSILDPTATFSVPPDHTAFGAVDAISHLLELYCTTRLPEAPLQDGLMEGLIETIMKSCNQALRMPDDYEARANLLWGAALSLSGMPSAGLGKVGFPMHMIEHSLSALYDIPHGAGLAVVIPGWLRYQADISDSKIVQLGNRLFGICEGGASCRAARTIARLTDWFTAIGCPTTLGQIKIKETDIHEIAANAVNLATVWRMRDYTQERIASILHLCL